MFDPTFETPLGKGNPCTVIFGFSTPLHLFGWFFLNSIVLLLHVNFNSVRNIIHNMQYNLFTSGYIYFLNLADAYVTFPPILPFPLPSSPSSPGNQSVGTGQPEGRAEG